MFTIRTPELNGRQRVIDVIDGKDPAWDPLELCALLIGIPALRVLIGREERRKGG